MELKFRIHQLIVLFLKYVTNQDPLGKALGLTPGETIEVADDELCQLAIPNDVVLEQCGPTDNIPNALVTDTRLCNVATAANICPTTSWHRFTRCICR